MTEAPFAGSDCPQTLAPSGMDALLARLRDQGGERFDGAGFYYLATLARRAAAHEGSARRMLEAKLALAAASFSDRFEQARAVAAELLATTCKQHPAAASALQQLFADSDFQGLRHLQATLQARQQCVRLTELVAQFEPGLAEAPLRAPAHHAPSPAGEASAPTLELKTVRESRATWARMSVHRQLSMAMQRAPKNAGPINSHMLVLRSLAMMKDISPDYLNRLVSYADTLLMLNPREKEVPVKRKKATPAKTGKPTKATPK